MSDFGQRLKNARKLRNLTQKELAEILAIAQSTIASYENNSRFPGESLLVKLSETLNVRIDYLLGTTEYESFYKATKKNDTVVDLSMAEYDTLNHRLIDWIITGKEKEATDRIFDLYQNGLSTLTLIEKVYLPILKLTGDLWQVGKVTVAEEHLISNLVDRWLSMTSTSQGIQSKPYSAVFMLPSNEEHVLILKIIREYFRHENWKTYFIGNSIPISSLHQFIDELDIQMVVISVSIGAHLNNTKELIQTLRTLRKDKPIKILVGGRAIRDERYALDELDADFFIREASQLRNAILSMEKQL